MRPRPAVILHEQNAVLGRANRFLARHADRLALSFAATERVPKVRDRGHRQSGASGDRRAGGGALRAARRTRCGCWCWAARSARGCSAMSCRRRWRRCPTRCCRGSTVVQQCRPEDLGRVRAAYDLGRHRRRTGRVLPGRGREACSGASGDRARRRLHRRRTGGRRPAGDPGAAAGCDRRPSDGQCARAGRGRRRIGDRAARLLARRAARAARCAAGCDPTCWPTRRRRGARHGACRMRRARLADRRANEPHEPPGGTAHEGAAAFHRHHPFRRHRRHRHVGHRRGAAQSRLCGAGQRHRRFRQCAPPARGRHSGRDRP